MTTLATFRRRHLAMVAALLLGGCALTPLPPTAPGAAAHFAATPLPWIAAWGSAQLAQAAAGADALPPVWQAPLQDVTLRQIVQITAAGTAVRVRVSNLFGQTPLELGGASVDWAMPDSAAEKQPGSHHALSFDGQRTLTLPAGTEAWSDPVPLALPALAELAVQLHILRSPAVATVHPGSRIRSWALPGQALDAGREGWAAAVPRDGWWHLTAVDVRPTQAQPVLVAIGDSITDGYGVPAGSYQRWTDALARRLVAQGRAAAVVNTGIGGNRLLQDGLGPHIVARFDRDVLARSGATHAVLLAGVNDLGVSHRQRSTTPASRAALLAELQAGLSTLRAQARGRGVCLFVGTVMPYGGSAYYQPRTENEADRQALNDWIRREGGFDAVLDFDALARDPARPSHLKPGLDNDGLHPSMAGYQAMADAFPLEQLDRRCPAR